jgi:hypothetical protein
MSGLGNAVGQGFAAFAGNKKADAAPTQLGYTSGIADANGRR